MKFDPHLLYRLSCPSLYPISASLRSTPILSSPLLSSPTPQLSCPLHFDSETCIQSYTDSTTHFIPGTLLASCSTLTSCHYPSLVFSLFRRLHFPFFIPYSLFLLSLSFPSFFPLLSSPLPSIALHSFPIPSTSLLHSLSPPSSLLLPSRFFPSFPLLPYFLLPISSITESNNSSNSNGSSKEPAQTTVADITDRSHFAAIIASKDLTVVDYWAPWCKYVRH